MKSSADAASTGRARGHDEGSVNRTRTTGSSKLITTSDFSSPTRAKSGVLSVVGGFRSMCPFGPCACADRRRLDLAALAAGRRSRFRGGMGHLPEDDLSIRKWPTWDRRRSPMSQSSPVSDSRGRGRCRRAAEVSQAAPFAGGACAGRPGKRVDPATAGRCVTWRRRSRLRRMVRCCDLSPVRFMTMIVGGFRHNVGKGPPERQHVDPGSGARSGRPGSYHRRWAWSGFF